MGWFRVSDLVKQAVVGGRPIMGKWGGGLESDGAIPSQAGEDERLVARPPGRNRRATTPTPPRDYSPQPHSWCLKSPDLLPFASLTQHGWRIGHGVAQPSEHEADNTRISPMTKISIHGRNGPCREPQADNYQGLVLPKVVEVTAKGCRPKKRPGA